MLMSIFSVTRTVGCPQVPPGSSSRTLHGPALSLTCLFSGTFYSLLLITIVPHIPSLNLSHLSPSFQWQYSFIYSLIYTYILSAHIYYLHVPGPGMLRSVMNKPDLLLWPDLFTVCESCLPKFIYWSLNPQ